VRPVERLAVWLYGRPRLRWALKGCGWLWFGAMWSVAAASPAAAGYSLWSVVGGTEFMAWTGLTDTYGEQVSHYYVSFVDPFTAGVAAAGSQLHGLNVFNPLKWVEALVAGFAGAIFNILASIVMSCECGILIFFGAAAIWFLKVALEAGWLPFMAQIAQPVVTALKQLVQDYYVIPIALLVALGWGGFVAFTRGRGAGLGVIGGALLVSLLIFYFLADPVSATVGPNGVLSIGQDLGFMLAEGVVNNGQLIPGNSNAGLQALIGTLCTALLREQIQLVNFGTSVDNIGGCAAAWTHAISAAKPDGPINAIKGCYPAGYTYGEQLGLASCGWFLMVIIVDFVIFVVLVYIAFTVILIGFKTLFNLCVLVVAAPVGVAPGPTRNFAKKRAVQTIRYGLEAFASTGGLAVIALIISAILNAPSNFLNPSEGVQEGFNWVQFGIGGAHPADDLNPIAKEIIVLVVAIACWMAYSRMLQEFEGPSAASQFGDWLADKEKSAKTRDFWKGRFQNTGLARRLGVGRGGGGGGGGAPPGGAPAGGAPAAGRGAAPGRVPPLPYGGGGGGHALPGPGGGGGPGGDGGPGGGPIGAGRRLGGGGGPGDGPFGAGRRPGGLRRPGRGGVHFADDTRGGGGRPNDRSDRDGGRRPLRRPHRSAEAGPLDFMPPGVAGDFDARQALDFAGRAAEYRAEWGDDAFFADVDAYYKKNGRAAAVTAFGNATIEELESRRGRSSDVPGPGDTEDTTPPVVPLVPGVLGGFGGGGGSVHNTDEADSADNLHPTLDEYIDGMRGKKKSDNAQSQPSSGSDAAPLRSGGMAFNESGPMGPTGEPVRPGKQKAYDPPEPEEKPLAPSVSTAEAINDWRANANLTLPEDQGGGPRPGPSMPAQVRRELDSGTQPQDGWPGGGNEPPDWMRNNEPVISWDTLDPNEAEALRGPDVDRKKENFGYLSQMEIWKALGRKDEE
jgi:hypothetical protein